jgi:glycosyltransferase involved in cell wall biosynthesis
VPNEIIVIDDGSEASIESLITVKSPILKVITTSHQGTSAARNLGIQLAESDYIAFLDADDIARPNRLKVQVESLRRSYDSLLSFCALEEFLSPEMPQNDARLLRSGIATVSGTLVAHRKAFEVVGPFKADLHFAYFMEWLQRARKLGLSQISSEEILVRRRLHNWNTSSRHPALLKEEYLKVIRSNMLSSVKDAETKNNLHEDGIKTSSSKSPLVSADVGQI